MSDVIDRPAVEREGNADTRLRVIDCDIHPSLHSHADLNQFLPKRWQEHLRQSSAYTLHRHDPVSAFLALDLPARCVATDGRSAWLRSRFYAQAAS
jgi:hypothetical protein